MIQPLRAPLSQTEQRHQAKVAKEVTQALRAALSQTEQRHQAKAAKEVTQTLDRKSTRLNSSHIL